MTAKYAKVGNSSRESWVNRRAIDLLQGLDCQRLSRFWTRNIFSFGLSKAKAKHFYGCAFKLVDFYEYKWFWILRCFQTYPHCFHHARKMESECLRIDPQQVLKQSIAAGAITVSMGDACINVPNDLSKKSKNRDHSRGKILQMTSIPEWLPKTKGA